MKKIIILLGLPGSGKGTQGEVLAKKINIPHISTGDIFRKMAKAADTEESRLLNEYMQAGKLIPAEVVNMIVKNFILSDECKIGAILDGYPRSLKQAQYFDENIEANVSTIFFEIDNDMVVKRILGRYNCATCGTVYNKYFDNPKIDNKCDQCGTHEFSFRTDDDEKTIISRIEEYKKETTPLIEYYKGKGNFFIVNAGANKKEVIKEIALIAKKI